MNQGKYAIYKQFYRIGPSNSDGVGATFGVIVTIFGCRAAVLAA